MSEYEIIEGLDKVQDLCGQVVNRMVVAKKQGRRMTLEGARGMDEHSLELIKMVKVLSHQVPDRLQTPELRRRAETLLDLSLNTLRLVVQSETTEARLRPEGLPRAAASRVAAYCAC